VIKEVIADMDYGMKKDKASFSIYVEILKWAGASFLLVIILILLGKYFFPYPDFFKNAAPEKRKISDNRTDESMYKEPVKERNIQNSLSKNAGDESEVNIPVEDKPTQKKAESEPYENIANVREDLSSMLSIQQYGTPVPNPAKIIQKESAKKEYLIPKIVKHNDNLNKIAKDIYGVSNDTIIDFIQMANPDIKDVNWIFVGQKINLPKIKRNDLIVDGENGNYHIHYASFYDFNDARRCVQELGDKKKKLFILQAHQQETEVYRVYYGLFNNSYDAQKELNALELKYLNFLK